MIEYLDIYIMWGRDPHCFKSDDSPQTVFCSLSGNGCRTYEHDSKSCSWQNLLFTLYSQDDLYRITRLDVAYDDFNHVIDMTAILDSVRFDRKQGREVMQDFCVSRFNKGHINEDSKGGLTVYFGSRSSDCLFRFYDKARERRSALSDEDFKLLEVSGYWIRFEMQLRNDCAANFVGDYLSTLIIGDFKSGDLGLVFRGVALNYLRFVVPDPNDSNKSRWELQDWYAAFIDDVERISIASKKDPVTSILKVDQWIKKQGMNALLSLFVTNGYSDLLYFAYKQSLKYKNGLPPPRYLNAINDWLQNNDLPLIRTSDDFRRYVDSELSKFSSGGVEF